MENSNNTNKTSENVEKELRISDVSLRSGQLVCRLHSMRKNCREYRYNKKTCKNCPHNVRSSDIKCTFCGHKAIYETLTNNNYLCDDNDCKLQYVDEIIRELK